MTSKIHRLTTPVSKEQATSLRVGDVVYLEGVVYTMRDRAHEQLFASADAGKKAPFDLAGAAVWHCGPVSRKGANGEWEITSIGPTTSYRLTRETPRLLKEFGVKVLIGKGGMGYEAVQAMCQEGAVFLSATGGCGGVYAASVSSVNCVHWPELGLPEAVWELNVRELGALIVGIDSTGTTLYGAVMKEAKNRISACYESLGIKDPEYRYIHWPPTLAGTKEVPESLTKTGGGE
ncbi:MAG: FumA C-terminus/TtdB family hydratase beta subunit [Candidatus Latescibacterota bacterium]